MTGELPMPDQPAVAEPLARPPRRAASAVLWAAILAFVLGAIVVALALPAIERWRAPVAVPSGTAQPLVAPLAPLTTDSLATRTAAVDAQLRGIETRIALAESASRTAASDATRAERLLIAIAARRELNRGLPLGYLETELRTHFADQPRAVAQTILAGRSPVTIEDLRQALDTIAPQLATGPVREGVWPAVKRELTSLVVIRKEAAPSPRPADRLIRARRMVDAGNVEGALAEVTRMPGAAGAKSWIDAANTYVAARRALGVLEMAALDATAPPPAPPPATTAPPRS